jgi:hypothetical protein
LTLVAEGGAETPVFTYICTDAPQPWKVGTNGTVVPPTRSRVMSYRVAGGDSLAGFRLATTVAALDLAAQNGDDWFNDTQIVVSPSGNEAVLDADAQMADPIFYSVGIGHAGAVYWDEPKIYHPPDDTTS